ncbi:hypothetical protein KJZ61_04330 [Candidatus Dependentiae bacterium]|nr:hypothetical protein [Candidatus Dependentiae bacterium]
MKYLIAAVATLIIVVLIVRKVFNYSYGKTSCGVVIILNGPSSSGKSTIQREFQYLMMPELWIKLGIDTLFDQPMPDIQGDNLSFWQTPNKIRWVDSAHDADHNAIITLCTGQEGEKVAYGMNSAIAAYAKEGCNVIVDYIAYKKEWLNDLHDKLKNIKTYWIKVNIPLHVLEEREVARGTSPKGHARSHYDSVHWDIKYDFEVHSDQEDAAEIAQRIKKFLNL